MDVIAVSSDQITRRITSVETDALVAAPLTAGLSPRSKVYLIGAGPGSIDYLTVKADKIIRSADLIIHDYVVSKEIISICKIGSEIIDAGLMGYGNIGWQNHLASKLAARAIETTQIVCRLKSGDPFIFGNGAETAEMLEALGCEVEVIPGLSSGIVGAVLAGFPLTHHAASKSISIVSGVSALEWVVLAKMETIILYMFLTRVGEVVSGLVGAGLDPGTPTAIIENASRSDQRVTICSLASLEGAIRAAFIQEPAILLVGKVVNFQRGA